MISYNFRIYLIHLTKNHICDKMVDGRMGMIFLVLYNLFNIFNHLIPPLSLSQFPYRFKVGVIKT